MCLFGLCVKSLDLVVSSPEYPPIVLEYHEPSQPTEEVFPTEDDVPCPNIEAPFNDPSPLIQNFVDQHGLAALEQTHTWDIVNLPPRKSLVGCKWVYKVKTKSAGTVERYKARLVAKGFTQDYGIDYEETFAPVACMTSVRTLIAVASIRGWQSSQDSALFIHQSSQGLVLLLLYVDDMIITGSDTIGIHDIKTHLGTCFEMKDLGPLHYFLGIGVNYSSSGYTLSQVKHASDLISRAGLTDNKAVDTPLELNVKLRSTDGELVSDPTLYRQLVRGLIYLTITRPDISYAVHVVSQFMTSPCTVHFIAILQILRYVRGTMRQGLLMSFSSKLELNAYSNSNWAGDVTDRRSTAGFCILLGDSLISWKSKKQIVVPRFLAEVEYRALADTTSKIIWLRRLLEDMGVTIPSPTPLHCDSKSTIQIAHNDVFHECTKHIEIDCHFIRHWLRDGVIVPPFIPS
uniref:Reverse transcriptase Ty1/copia-type domain-containing protein n=1 Tax=Fagus sylvatica TaxID=28930 RepID=A0A2N9IMY5_FAGSY